MTSKAGLIPVIKCLDKLGFNQLFQKTVDHKRKDNAVYRLEDGVFLILTGLIGGAFNISKCALLWSGCRVLQKTAGWLRISDETTLGRLFKEVTVKWKRWCIRDVKLFSKRRFAEEPVKWLLYRRCGLT